MSKVNKCSIPELYNKIWKWYDEHRSKHLMEIFYLNFIAEKLPPNAKILDVGCGNGEPIAKYFLEKGFELTGIDASKNMLELCAKRFPQMRCILEDMRTLNLPQKFHALIVWDSFFHLAPEDQRGMFKIFAKHLLPGGLLLFTAGPSHGEVYGTMDGYEFYHASLSQEEYAELFNTHGFELLMNKIEDPDCGEHSVWIIKLK